MRPDSSPHQPLVTRRAFLRLGLALGGAGLLAACAQPAPSPTVAPAKATQPGAPAQPAPTVAPAAKALSKVKVGVIATVVEQAWNDVAIARGFYKDEGIDVEVSEFRDGGTIFRALQAGEIDLYEGGFSSLPPAQEKGAPVRIVGGSKPGLAFALYARKDIEKLEDLYGKEVGAAAPGSFLHLLMLALFQVKKLDVSKVNFVNIGASGDVFRAVAAGKVAAGPAPINFKPQADRDPNMKTLLIFDDVVPDYPRVCFAAQTRGIAEKGEALAGALAAWVRGYRYGVEHVDEVINAAVEKFKQPREDMDFYFKWQIDHRVLALNLEVDPKGIQFMQEMNVAGKVQEKVLPFEQVVDLSLQQKVLQQIGRVEWKTPLRKG